METQCNFGKKRFLIALILVAIAYFGMDMVFHHFVLGKTYEATMSLWRPMPEMMAKRWVAYTAYLLFSFLFLFIFNKGFEKGKCPRGQGIRYGFLMGLLYWGTHLLGSYPFNPWPDTLYLAWFGIGMVEFVVLGLIAGLLVSKERAA